MATGIMNATGDYQMGSTPASDKSSKMAGDKEPVKAGMGKKSMPDRERTGGPKKMPDVPTKNGFDPDSRGR
jgi:hypothetical protein